MTTTYPLAWPHGRRRTEPGRRKDGKFGRSIDSGRGWRERQSLTIADAIRRLQDELDRLGARQLVLSSNLEVRLDGLPRSGQAQPIDPGVAVYFQLGGKPHCMPCDTYQRVEHNIAAVAAHIDATRAIERHGVATVAEMFAGFVALPPPTSHWEALGLKPGAGKDAIEAAYRAKAKAAHPDTGGSTNAMADLNVARAAALKEAG